MTKQQFARVEKAKTNNKGIILNLSKTQVQKMKIGGFLPFLIPLILAGVTAAATAGISAVTTNSINKKFKDDELAKKKKELDLENKNKAVLAANELMKPSGSGLLDTPLEYHVGSDMPNINSDNIPDLVDNTVHVNKNNKLNKRSKTGGILMCPSCNKELTFDGNGLYPLGSGLYPLGAYGQQHEGGGQKKTLLFPNGVKKH
jgi:hypothetical protein